MLTQTSEEDEDNNLNSTNMESNKLSYEIFSILESKFLFGYDDNQTTTTNNTNNTIKNDRGKVRVLCIDSGGMRGILPAKALSYLEKALKTKSGNSEATISDFFDVAAGTGVGGLFAAMLFASKDGSIPLFSAEETANFLTNNANHIYRKPPSRSSSSSSFLRCFFGENEEPSSSSSTSISTVTAEMEKAMKDMFGDALTLRNTLKPLLIPCYDLKTSAPLVFSRADALESKSFDFRLWEVVRATWAELGRVEPVEMTSVDGQTVCVGADGGLAMMNNPAIAAITHVLHNKQEFPFVRGVEDLMVLSLGCGAVTGSVVGTDEVCRIRRWGGKEWCRPVAKIAADGSAELVDHAVALAFGQCRNENYVRVQPNILRIGKLGVDVDSDSSITNVKALMAAADDMLNQKNVESVLFGGRRVREQTNMEKLDWFAKELVLEHERRSSRIAPTVAFKQVVPNSSI